METPCADPLNAGFDINVAGHAAGAPGSYHGEMLFGNQPDGSWQAPWGVPRLEKYHHQDINLTEALTREALRILDTVATDQNPFYLYLSHYGVHTPIEADSAFYPAYLERGLDTVEARYASMVESIDHSLGQVMDYLDEHQLSEQTIILFMSDNGGLSAVARGGEPHTHNAPLHSGKGSAYEGGIRVPMLAKWPGEITPGSRQEQYVIIEDFFPSILEMAGIQPDTLTQTTDGQSFVPFLRKQGKKRYYASPLLALPQHLGTERTGNRRLQCRAARRLETDLLPRGSIAGAVSFTHRHWRTKQPGYLRSAKV